MHTHTHVSTSSPESGEVTLACPGTHCICQASVSQPSNFELQKSPFYKRPKETYFILLAWPGDKYALCLSKLPQDP